MRRRVLCVETEAQPAHSLQQKLGFRKLLILAFEQKLRNLPALDDKQDRNGDLNAAADCVSPRVTRHLGWSERKQPHEES